LNVFVDTSALVEVIDHDAPRHAAATGEWEAMLRRDDALICTNYVMVETVSLVQRRLGMDAVRLLCADIAPALHVEWIGREVHEDAMTAMLAAGRRKLSLIDCASFVVMRRLGIRGAFAFDSHFEEEGFECLPGGA